MQHCLFGSVDIARNEDWRKTSVSLSFTFWIFVAKVFCFFLFLYPLKIINETLMKTKLSTSRKLEEIFLAGGCEHRAKHAVFCRSVGCSSQ